MSIEVREVTGAAEAQLVYDAAVREFAERFQCNAQAPPYPTWQELLRGIGNPYVLVLAAWRAGKPMMFALVERPHGRIYWLCPCVAMEECTPPGTEDGAYAQLCLRVARECGACWGAVENAELRERLLAVSPLVHVDGNRSHWTGEPRPAEVTPGIGVSSAPMAPITAPNQPRGAQPGETGTDYRLAATAAPSQRPGGIPGSTTGAEGDSGRDGLAKLLPDGVSLPPHTGY